MKTIDKIITKVSCEFGAPMGRNNVGAGHKKVTGTFLDTILSKPIIYDCAIPMDSSGAYDKGGAYWGTGSQLRVSYTKDLSYIEFYRK